MPDKIITVDDRYTIRPTEATDFDAVLGLHHAWEASINGRALTTAEELQQEWDDPDFELDKSTRVAFDQAGRLVGYCQVGHEKEMPVRPGIGVMLDPDNIDFALGLALFQWGEAELQRVFPLVPDHAKVTLTSATDSRRTDFLPLYELAGLKPSGQIWQKMLITMEAKPEEADLDPAVTIVTGDVFNDNRAVYNAHQDSFRDHRNFVARDREQGFKRWTYWLVEDERTYDPSLWFLAIIDGRIAGLALCETLNTNYPDEGYVAILGVLPAYRGRGIAKYLLVHAFREYWERGMRKVGLMVDGSSITGADKLYLKAGMQVDKAYATYEKVLRDGEELSVQ